MKTHAIAALLVLGVVSSCGQDEPTPANSTTPSVGTPAVAAKPELVPIGSRRVIELEDGVRIEVLAEGQGDFVAPGDEVALSLTLSYVPQSAPKVEETPPTDAPADDGKSSSSEKKDKKPRASKSADSKSAPDSAKSEPEKLTETAQSDATESKSEDAQVADEKSVVADVDNASNTSPAGDTESAKAEVENASTEIATAETSAPLPDATTHASDGSAAVSGAASPTSDASAPTSAATTSTVEGTPQVPEATAPAHEGTAPAPEPLAAPLEPIVVLSTKNLGTPIRARVGASSTLVPGLSRALVGLRQGTIAEITLPAEAAYGAGGLPSAGIPAGTTLLATIEIREVRR